MFATQRDETRKLRALWTLRATGGLTDEKTIQLLDHASEHVRWWGIHWLSESGKVSAAALDKFARMSRDDGSRLVRLALASALQRLPVDQRWSIAEGLAGHGEDADDPNLPLMIWYGIEPATAADKSRALKLAAKSQIPRVRQFIARRVAGD
jgi:hypothetical protein